MKIRAALLFSLFATTAFAQVPGKAPPPPAFKEPPPPPAAAPSLKAPPELTGAKKQTVFGAALRRSGIFSPPPPVPPPAYAKLTALATSIPGARIASAGTSGFLGVSIENPEGALLFAPRPNIPTNIPTGWDLIMPRNEPSAPSGPSPTAAPSGPAPMGTMFIELTTEPNAYYFVDCRASQAGAGSGASFTRGNAPAQEVVIDDGHFVFAFRAPGPRELVTVVFRAATRLYACEITKSS